MTFKEKAVAALRASANLEINEETQRIISECAQLVNGLPDEEYENARCAAPNYEAMYSAAQAELMEQKKLCENMACELRAMHLNNARLTGYREAVERIFGEGV